MKESEVLDLLARLQAAYREQISTPERNLWADLLADAEAPAAFGAVEARIRSGDPYRRPAECAGGVGRGARGGSPRRVLGAAIIRRTGH